MDMKNIIQNKSRISVEIKAIFNSNGYIQFISYYRILSVALTDLNFYIYNIYLQIYKWLHENKLNDILATCIAPLKLIPVSIAT